MPHQRLRHLLLLILKRRKLWPVLGILGPRQVGKSTLLRAQLAPKVRANYVSLDRKENRDSAEKSPSLFLTNETPTEKNGLLIIDEVQKAPELFDAIKAEIDENRRPSRFLLTGSTQFSTKVGIRESLTGRMGLMRLYPFLMSELYERDFVSPWVSGKPEGGATLKEVQTFLVRGGMPGPCFIRDDVERGALFDAYLDTACFRDLQQVRQGRISGELAREILGALARLEDPTISEAAILLRQDARRIRSHVEALEAIFLLNRLDAHPAGIGKSRYLIFDSGLATHLGASHFRCLETWALNECLAQFEYSGSSHPRIRYYRSSKHSFVNFVIEKGTHLRGAILLDEETLSPYLERTVLAFRKKLPKSSVTVLAPVHSTHREKAFFIAPWSAFS